MQRARMYVTNRPLRVAHTADRQGHKLDGTQRDSPPFRKADEAVLVHIHVLEEGVQPALRHGQAHALEGSLQFLLVQPAVVVAVYRFEEEEELALRRLDEDAELYSHSIISQPSAPVTYGILGTCGRVSVRTARARGRVIGKQMYPGHPQRREGFRDWLSQRGPGQLPTFVLNLPVAIGVDRVGDSLQQLVGVLQR